MIDIQSPRRGSFGRRIACLLVPIAVIALSIGYSAQPDQVLEDDTPRLDHDFRVRYAECHHELAQLALKRDQEANEKSRGTVPAAMIELDEQRVEAARKVVEAARSGTDEFEIYVQLAETAVSRADGRLRRWTAVHRAAPDAVSQLDIDRLRVQSELARLMWTQGRTLRDSTPEIRNLWKTRLLLDQLRETQEDVERSSRPGGDRTRLLYPR